MTQSGKGKAKRSWVIYKVKVPFKYAGIVTELVVAPLSIKSLPFCQLHYCVGLWGSADLCPFRWSPRTHGWTSGQSPHCRCSPPSASLALQDLCGGNHMCTTQWLLLSRSEPQHGSLLHWWWQIQMPSHGNLKKTPKLPIRHWSSLLVYNFASFFALN